MPNKRERFQHAHKAAHKLPSKKKSKNSAATASSTTATKETTANPAKSKAHQQKQHQEPIIPFSPSDTILLIGEGDLSFAVSIITHHNCTNVTATVLEKNLSELTTKYPQASENLTKIQCSGSKVLFDINAQKMAPFRKPLMDRIIFNFPHVGGKSTDVNRQVRYNQELLVSFFKHALPSLSLGGTIIVTLFEGEPYTLWNIRDLARHSGLAVERSFRFQSSAYPGYHHSRTLGIVKNKKGEEGGGWKGEDREARSYVFARKDEAPKPVIGTALTTNKKRKRWDDSDSSDGEDDD
jgi:25S rRNA (uracil2634-N3)-methyltransferase